MIPDCTCPNVAERSFHYFAPSSSSAHPDRPPLESLVRPNPLKPDVPYPVPKADPNPPKLPCGACPPKGLEEPEFCRLDDCPPKTSCEKAGSDTARECAPLLAPSPVFVGARSPPTVVDAPLLVTGPPPKPLLILLCLGM